MHDNQKSGLPRLRRAHAVILLAFVVILTACGDTSTSVGLPTAPAPVPLATPSLVDIAPELLTPLFMLPECGPVTDPMLDESPPGLILPEGSFMTRVRDQNGLINVEGYAPLTPILFQLTFRENPDLEMITVENEIQESETLYSDGEWRVFLKAAAVCQLGVGFIAVIAPEENRDAVPTPSGSPSQ